MQDPPQLSFCLCIIQAALMMFLGEDTRQDFLALSKRKKREMGNSTSISSSPFDSPLDSRQHIVSERDTKKGKSNRQTRRTKNKEKKETKEKILTSSNSDSLQQLQHSMPTSAQKSKESPSKLENTKRSQKHINRLANLPKSPGWLFHADNILHHD